MKLYKQILLLLFILTPALSFSQRWKLSRSEIMGGIGATNYLGDLGGAMENDAPEIKNIDWGYTRPSIFVGYRYRLYDRVAIKGQLSYARFYGSDVASKNESRNYSFSSNMVELYGHFEYHLTEEKQKISYKTMSLRGKLQKFNAGLNFYIFAGVGGAFYKVKPLDTFSTSSRYTNKNLAVIFPLGIGFKYPLSMKTYIGMEFGRRFTSSDYIDGFSPEASEHTDAYYFTVINVSYKIKRKNKRRPEYRF